MHSQSAWIKLERDVDHFYNIVSAKCYYYLKVTMNCVYVVKLMLANPVTSVDCVYLTRLLQLLYNDCFKVYLI